MSDQRRSYNVVCRGSLLSRAQADIFVNRLKQVQPHCDVKIMIQDTLGDREQQALLADMDGRDYFTKDIQDVLLSGKADFAVHSLKDVSSEQFFQGNPYAIVERDDPRDVAIFRSDILEVLKEGRPIRIGTSSPRRALMATEFLTKALPRTGAGMPIIQAASIRGNVDTRIRKLKSGEFDGIILAAAGINRLLSFEESRNIVRELLSNTRFMVLPLIECPPAPGQGAIVAEASTSEPTTADALKRINVPHLLEATHSERVMSLRYGAGCHQQFGVIHIDTRHLSFTYGAGKSGQSGPFVNYEFVTSLDPRGKQMFSTGDYMKELFIYKPMDTNLRDGNEALFISSHHAVHSTALTTSAMNRRVWTAGTRTWFGLAAKGIWVEGCADGLGLDFIQHWIQQPLINIDQGQLLVLTDRNAVSYWTEKGWKVQATYEAAIAKDHNIASAIAAADVVFWSGFAQYEAYKSMAKPGVSHCCAPGKVADQLIRMGVKPNIFPGIKGFNEWRRKTHITSATGG